VERDIGGVASAAHAYRLQADRADTSVAPGEVLCTLEKFAERHGQTADWWGKQCDRRLLPYSQPGGRNGTRYVSDPSAYMVWLERTQIGPVDLIDVDMATEADVAADVAWNFRD
jgi:hypothetical protein